MRSSNLPAYVLLWLAACSVAGGSDISASVLQISHAPNGEYCMSSLTEQAIDCCPEGWELVGTVTGTTVGAQVCVYYGTATVLELARDGTVWCVESDNSLLDSGCCPEGWESIGSLWAREVCVLY